MRAPDLERQIYVAPVEPPPARRPPVTSVGALGWLRANLFSSWANSLATLVTGALLLWFLGTFVAWAVTSAQWSVVTNNLRLITSGLYPRAEIWRVELTAALLVFLTGLGLGIWGRVARSVDRSAGRAGRHRDRPGAGCEHPCAAGAYPDRAAAQPVEPGVCWRGGR